MELKQLRPFWGEGEVYSASNPRIARKSLRFWFAEEVCGILPKHILGLAGGIAGTIPRTNETDNQGIP